MFQARPCHLLANPRDSPCAAYPSGEGQEVATEICFPASDRLFFPLLLFHLALDRL
jgi:hypothetical protein